MGRRYLQDQIIKCEFCDKKRRKYMAILTIRNLHHYRNPCLLDKSQPLQTKSKLIVQKSSTLSDCFISGVYFILTLHQVHLEFRRYRYQILSYFQPKFTSESRKLVYHSNCEISSLFKRKTKFTSYRTRASREKFRANR